MTVLLKFDVQIMVLATDLSVLSRITLALTAQRRIAVMGGMGKAKGNDSLTSYGTLQALAQKQSSCLQLRVGLPNSACSLFLGKSTNLDGKAPCLNRLCDTF